MAFSMMASPASAVGPPWIRTARRFCWKPILFDFSGDLYGETCTVSLVSYLRGEEKFDGLDALVAQMKTDEAEARAVLAAIQPLSPLDAAMTFETGHDDRRQTRAAFW
jgi:hypothetical protein